MILEINMYQTATTHDLLVKFAAEVKSDAMLVSNQYPNQLRGISTYQIPLPFGFGMASNFELCPTPGRWLCGDSVFRDKVFLSYLTPNETKPNFRRRLGCLQRQGASMEHALPIL